jgi:quinol monooxygenase YgiN
MCKDIVAFSSGRMSNSANGILEFSASQDVFEPHVFHMWERYDSNASLGVHNTTPEYTAFMERVRHGVSGEMHTSLFTSLYRVGCWI